MTTDVRPPPAAAAQLAAGWNVLQWIALWVWTAACVTFALLCIPVTRRRDIPLVLARRLWAPGAYRVTGLRLHVDYAAGAEQIDWTRPHVFVMNHESVADIPAAFMAVPANLRFVAKKAFAYMPFVGLYMWATGMIFVERHKPRRAYASLQRAAARIRGGVSILAFPEGTRSRGGVMGRFKRGAFVLAREAGVPVVPLVGWGAGQRMPPDGMRIRPGWVRVRVGAPVQPRHDEEPQALAERVRDQMLRLRDELAAAGDQSLVSGASFWASTLPKP